MFTNQFRQIVLVIGSVLAVSFGTSSHASIIVTLTDDFGPTALFVTISGSGTVTGPTSPTPPSPPTFDFSTELDIGAAFSPAMDAVFAPLQVPIGFSPGISIVELALDWDGQAKDDFGIIFSGPVAVGTQYNVSGTSIVPNVKFADLNPGTYSGFVNDLGMDVGGITLVIKRSVPAPATIALFVIGLAGLGWSTRKKV